MASGTRKELEKIKKRILYLGTSVENNLHMAVRALQNYDVELAHKVKESDHEIDKNEVRLEDQCLEVLALHQPVAGDLRFLVTVLKINIDLERIGDLAVKIADKVLLPSFSPRINTVSRNHFHVHEKLNAMFISTFWMLNKSLDAFYC